LLSWFLADRCELTIPREASGAGIRATTIYHRARHKGVS
jgi:hypothetical protein